MIDFRRPGAETAAASPDDRRSDRLKEANDLLDMLGRTKRVAAEDRAIFARNLGRLITNLGVSDRMAFAKTVLEEKWDKRKAYILFPDESPGTRFAASGGDLKEVILRIVNQRSAKVLSHANALIQTVYEALKGSSFRRSERFSRNSGRSRRCRLPY